VGDLAAVIRAEGRDSAWIVGHDWGGLIGWHMAMSLPHKVDGLAVLNAPHPSALAREMQYNPRQQQCAAYVSGFQQLDSHRHLNAHMLAGLAADDEDSHERYLQALSRSSFQALMNYYRENCPLASAEQAGMETDAVCCPVLQILRMDDPYFDEAVLYGTQQWVEADYFLAGLTGAGHWVHHDRSADVNNILSDWLQRSGFFIAQGEA